MALAELSSLAVLAAAGTSLTASRSRVCRLVVQNPERRHTGSSRPS
jgi:hypothetical protein